MKNAILGFTYTFVIIYMFVINVSIMQKDIRQSELDQAVNAAVRQTMVYAYENDDDGNLAILSDAIKAKNAEGSTNYTKNEYTSEQLKAMANEQLEKVFKENLRIQMNSLGSAPLDEEVNVITADVQNGILDVKVTRKFPYMFNTDSDRKKAEENPTDDCLEYRYGSHIGTVETRRTVIQNKAISHSALSPDTDMT